MSLYKITITTEIYIDSKTITAATIEADAYLKSLPPECLSLHKVSRVDTNDIKEEDENILVAGSENKRLKDFRTTEEIKNPEEIIKNKTTKKGKNGIIQ